MKPLPGSTYAEIANPANEHGYIIDPEPTLIRFQNQYGRVTSMPIEDFEQFYEILEPVKIPQPIIADLFIKLHAYLYLSEEAGGCPCGECEYCKLLASFKAYNTYNTTVDHAADQCISG